MSSPDTEFDWHDDAEVLAEENEAPCAENGHFSRLPAAAVYDRRLSHANVRFLAALGAHADRNGYCFPSMTKLAQQMGCTRQNVRYHIGKLEKFGYVNVTRRKGGNGRNEVNLYQLVYPAKGERPKSPGVANPGLTIGQILHLRGGKS